MFLTVMVSCNAPGCGWERATDNRGLSRHRASCHFYKRVSSLASRRRHDRAKEAVISSFIPKPSAGTSVSDSDSCFKSDFQLLNLFDILFQGISAIRHVKDRPSLVPIAPCRLVGPISMACGLSSAEPASSLTDSRHRDSLDSEQQQNSQNHDVQVENDTGVMIELDHCDSGSYHIIRLSSNFVSLITCTFQGIPYFQ